MIKIDKNINYEQKTKNFPFKDMEIGDSFLIPKNTEHTTVRVKASIFRKSKNKEVKFSIRKTLEGFRCWRIL